ncbi:MAG: hypothetical protein FJ009_19450 [Chloroflexi bacterium]|nr:hypothetical protein [Chloroflexota bacterium]
MKTQTLLLSFILILVLFALGSVPTSTLDVAVAALVRGELTSTLHIVSDSSWLVSGILVSGWETVEFDDSGWEFTVIPAPVNCGFPTCSFIGKPDISTMWSAIQYQTIYLRKQFFIESSSAVLSATIETRCDDDHDVYINGTLVASDWDGVAGPLLKTDIRTNLQNGKNVIAIKAGDTGGCRHLCVDANIILQTYSVTSRIDWWCKSEINGGRIGQKAGSGKAPRARERDVSAIYS